MKNHLPRLLLVLGALLSGAQAIAQSTSFTYQGQLRQSGEPFTGMADLEFRLYDQLINGNQIGATQSLSTIPVEDGLFQVELDFTAAAFDGSDRFLEITVDGAPLSPRQKITATPYALLATGLASGSVGGGSIDPTEVQLRVDGTCPPGEYMRRVNQDGSVLCAIDDTGSAGWRLGGNAGTNPTSDFVGTTDMVPLDIRVNGNRAMRYEWGFSGNGAPNLIGGVANNSIPDSNEASVIAGGGLFAAPNSITGNASSIGGGLANVINGSWSTIPGGRVNTINSNDSVAMGQGATANHDNVFVWNDGGSFASTAPDQFLIDARGGVGIGTNSPSDQLHISVPSGDALRVQIGGQTRFRIHDNGGVSIGVNATPPADGLLVAGDIRVQQPRTKSLMIGHHAFSEQSSFEPYNWLRTIDGLEINPVVGCIGSQDFSAPVQLPDGATVTTVRLFAIDNDGNANFFVRLNRVQHYPTSGAGSLAEISTSGASSSVRQFTDSTIAFETIDNSQYSYYAYINAQCPQGPFEFRAIQIVYEVTDVL